MAFEDDWTREAVRLHRRYLVEVVDAYGLCPWADRATREGRVRERVVLQIDEAAMEPSLAAIDAWMADPTTDVAFIIYPRLRVTRHGFHDFTARVRDADTPRHELGRVPFVFAAFHPDATPDTTDPERLIPFLRRTPDPTLQLLRTSVLDGIRSGASQGTQFVDMDNLDAALAGTGQPPLRERIARANLATAERVGLEVVRGRFDDICRDREETYAALARAERHSKPAGTRGSVVVAGGTRNASGEPIMTTTDLKDELKKGLEHLQTLRDEVRVRLHLAGMEAKDEWNKLEPHLIDVERAAQEASEASRRAVTDAVAKLKKLRESL